MRRAPLLPNLLALARSVDIETPWLLNSSPAESTVQMEAALEADHSPRSPARDVPRGRAPNGERATPVRLDSSVEHHQRVYKSQLARGRAKARRSSSGSGSNLAR